MPVLVNTSSVPYNYKVHSIDIQLCSIIVTYTPIDEELLPVQLNCVLHFAPYDYFRHSANNELIYAIDQEIPFREHLKYSIENSAPIHQWKMQKMMIDNMSDIDNLKL